MLVHVLLVICTLVGVTQGASNRCRYRESRVTEQVIIRRRVCSPKLSQVGEEYWTSVGYDGKLRHGREISDFLTLPQNGDAGIRDGWVAYWITKSRYGRGLHYEAFGHAFLRQDGRVCAWFAGRDRDAVELCEGFRVLSRNKNNPNEEMPFEWIQAGYARPRETLGFHHHRIAKYEYTPADIFFGDAHLRSGTFRGVSPTSRFYMEMTKPDLFAQKVWVLRRKPESVRDLGGGVRPEWQSHQNGQRHGHMESERSAQPAWSSDAVREQYSGQPSDSRLQSHSEYPSNSEPDRMDPNAIREVQRERDQTDPNVIRDVQPESDQIDPNAIHEVHRPPPEWVTRTKPRTKSTEVHDDAGLQSRNHVRFRYVRPEVVKTDQYGKSYKPPASDSAEKQHAESTTVGSQRIPEHDHQRGQEQSPRIEADVAQWLEAPLRHTLGIDLRAHGPPSFPYIRGRRIGTKLVREDSSTGSIHRDYESRRKAYNEEYLRQLDQRRQHAARLRADEERRRQETNAQEPRNHHQQRTDARQRTDERDNSITRDTLTDNEEIPSFPERLPTPRALLKSEVEEFDT